MATVKVILNQRKSHINKQGQSPLNLVIGHKSKEREIPLNLYLSVNQFDPITRKVSGVTNSVKHSKRIQKLFGDVDLWLEDNRAMIKLWSIDKLKSEIEHRFFNKQNELSVLAHGAKYLYRLTMENRFSTATSYEDALKALIKYRLKLARRNSDVVIKTLFKKSPDSFEILEEYAPYDLPIKAVDVEFVKDFKAHLSSKMSSNTVGIYLRSLQAIFNDAAESYRELAGHEPFTKIKKGSTNNAPNPLTIEEVRQLRSVMVIEGSAEFHAKNFFLFMFNNMGMNFIDIALIKRFQFDGERVKYFREKTKYEGDFFSIKQNEESLQIINYYCQGQEPDEYIFPVLPADISPARMHRVKNDRLGWFNKHLRRVAQRAGIKTTISSYSARDTWTNVGFDLGIDIRKISAGLGHSSIEVTNKHYGASIQEKILDEINARITA